MWAVSYLPEAEAELEALPGREQAAMIKAARKLQALGPNLVPPHSSAVRGIPGTLRELRPRAGRSPWRALYQQVGQEFVIAAVAPDGKSDSRGFMKMALRALERLEKVEVA